eukprot:TRINITY_DN17793_c0_g1_i1.p1 TRINITY_DN17793_c0_g1~~TRINITY_DN17793_c0_g1_i1.p1  ORF type:complete len:290 (+),score=30.60 TRINITY_DN17793_c0_g1_i1:28-870(+)
MILKNSLLTRRLEQKRFIKLHMGIQIFLLLTGICCCLVASHLINISNSNNWDCNTLENSGDSFNNTLARKDGKFIVSAVSLMTFGLVQSIPSILLIIIHILYGYIAKTENMMIHLGTTLVQLVCSLVSTTATAVLLHSLTNSICSHSNKELIYGLPLLILILIVAAIMHLMVIVLLLSVDFDIFKEPSPLKIHIESHRSPAMFISREELRGVKDSADLLRLHDILRTRLPSLRSNHPTHPPSPGFINSLSEIALSPFLTQPNLVLPTDNTFKPFPAVEHI